MASPSRHRARTRTPRLDLRAPAIASMRTENAERKEQNIHRLRVVTYNIHKCRGLDRRISAARIISVIHPLEADILCLQEVVNAPGTKLYDQASEISRAFPAHAFVFGANRPLHGGTYGNITL